MEGESEERGVGEEEGEGHPVAGGNLVGAGLETGGVGAHVKGECAGSPSRDALTKDHLPATPAGRGVR
jgi:hypothetical protein